MRKTFWIPFLGSILLLSGFFAWELGYFGQWLPRLPRPEPTQTELAFTALIVLLLSLNIGLAWFRIRQGTCPIGARRASAVAGVLGVVTLLCPACLLIPISILGITISLTFLTPYLPLLQIIVLILLGASTMMLWPKR